MSSSLASPAPLPSRVPRTAKPRTLSQPVARRLWLQAQGLDRRAPFGGGPAATPLAVAHLGYVQIDTINVIERSHHHILFSRIPDYRRAHLHRAQTVDKAVFEYWTHALSYVAIQDFRYFVTAMRTYDHAPKRWFAGVKTAELRKVLRRIREGGPLSIRDIDDDVLVDKDHEWASRKPSRRAMQLAFYRGLLAVKERVGMLKTYELMERHFGWDKLPRGATERELTEYLLDRALRSQGIISLDSACYQDAPRKPAMQRAIDRRRRRGLLVPVALEGAKALHWAAPETLETVPAPEAALVHILSPFDPLIIQRKRLHNFFGYEHRFEAYVPKAKRRFGYFALPVLVGDAIVAAIDLKTDRAARKVLVQKWTWLDRAAGPAHKAPIEDELHRFERFQLAGGEES
jgi:uncharacterized protein YcaQ